MLRYENAMRISLLLLGLLLLGGSMLFISNRTAKESLSDGWRPANEDMRQLLQEQAGVESIAEKQKASSSSQPPPQSKQEQPMSKPPELIKLNQATAKQLEELPGVGPSIAKAIVELRTKRGGAFQTIDQLLEVKGIGAKLLDKIRPHVVLEPN